METKLIAEIQRQLDGFSPEQMAELRQHIRALSPERKAHLDRIAAHLASRYGYKPDTLPRTGMPYPNARVNESGRYDGFDLEVQDMPELSGFVPFSEWVYIARRAAADAMDRARIHLGKDFDVTAEIRAARDASMNGLLAGVSSGEEVAPASYASRALASTSSVG